MRRPTRNQVVQLPVRRPLQALLVRPTDAVLRWRGGVPVGGGGGGGPVIPDNALTYNGAELTYNGAFLTYTPA